MNAQHWSAPGTRGEAIVRSFGVIYVAFGAPYLGMALNSVLSLRTTNPNVPICIVTNVVRQAPVKPWWRPDLGDEWIFLQSNTDQNRQVKTQIYKLSPFSRTLYLDCDTMVFGDLTPLLWPLDYFDLLICAGENRTLQERRILDGKYHYSENGLFNGGVICFRRGSAVEDFFARWHQSLIALAYPQDQPALMEAYCLSGIRIFPLSTKWNTGDRWMKASAAREEIVIWHYKMRLEPMIEKTLLKAVDWYGGDESHLADTHRFIQRKGSSRHRISIQWKLRQLVTKMRGDLTRRLSGHPNGAQWLQWISDK